MSRDDFYASAFGALYSAYMERPRLSGHISRLVWGGDVGPYYESMAAVGELADGATVVDCPCGAGPALRALPAGCSIRYIGVDLFFRSRDTLRQRLLIRPHTGDFGPFGTQSEIESSLTRAGFDPLATRCSGPLFFFDAHRRC